MVCKINLASIFLFIESNYTPLEGINFLRLSSIIAYPQSDL